MYKFNLEMEELVGLLKISRKTKTKFRFCHFRKIRDNIHQFIYHKALSFLQSNISTFITSVAISSQSTLHH